MSLDDKIKEKVKLKKKMIDKKDIRKSEISVILLTKYCKDCDLIINQFETDEYYECPNCYEKMEIIDMVKGKIVRNPILGSASISELESFNRFKELCKEEKD